ncbi:Uncharacterized protein Rs2_27696 [Raphanus sativus]|nr:Uncharacterized protein Rs2_27696 [Raphanus sativus]
MMLPDAPEGVEVNSRSRERISALDRIEEQPNLSAVRVSALERIEERIIPSIERISALERIEPPNEELQRATGLSSSLLARLQDVEVQYEDGEHQSPLVEEPQRTPAALRLGVASASRKKNPVRAATKKPTQRKPVTKKAPTGKVTATVKARGNQSPLQGARTTKQRAARGRPPARKRLLRILIPQQWGW